MISVRYYSDLISVFSNHSLGATQSFSRAHVPYDNSRMHTSSIFRQNEVAETGQKETHRFILACLSLLCSVDFIDRNPAGGGRKEPGMGRIFRSRDALYSQWDALFNRGGAWQLS